MNALAARLIAGGALLAAVIITILIYRGQALDAKADLAASQAKVQQLETVNRANALEMVRLQAAADANAAIAEAVAGSKMEITVRTQEGRAAIAEARRSNPDVAEYLDGAVPADVRGVLNGKPANPDPDGR